MTFIIAEAGVNFRNFNEADELIRLCSAAGVNAVKFQAHSDDIIYSLPNDLSKHLKSIQLNEERIRYLYWRCCQNKVEFMCTPMYSDAVKMLDPYVKRWKIREKDSQNFALINKCIHTNKEVLISLQDPWDYPFNKIKQLYCIPEYPPKKGHDLINNYKGFDGVSCHYPCVPLALDFVKLGAKYLEIHVKKNEYPDNYEPIDNNVSITTDELKELVDTIRSWE